MASPIATGARPNSNQRTPRIAGIDGQLDEAQWECAAIETMSRSSPARRWRVVAIQGSPRRYQLIDCDLMQIALLVAEQLRGGKVARGNVSMLVDQYRSRRPMRQRQMQDRRT
jgi:hypothetical protein